MFPFENTRRCQPVKLKALGHVEYSKPTNTAIMTTYYFLRVGPITSLKLIDRNIIVISKYIKL